MAKGGSFAEWRCGRMSLDGPSRLAIVNHKAIVGYWVLPGGSGSPGRWCVTKGGREIEAGRRYLGEWLAEAMRADGYDATGDDVPADPAWRSNSGGPLWLGLPFDPAEPSSGVDASLAAGLRSYFEEAEGVRR